MAPVTAPAPPPRLRRSRRAAGSLWLVLLAVTIGFGHLPRGTLDGLWEEVPRSLQVPVAAWISAAMDWLVNDASFGLFSFRDLTRVDRGGARAAARGGDRALRHGLLQGQGSAAVQLLPPLPWFAVLIAARLIALHAGGPRPGALTAGGLLYLAVFGQWQSAMVTLVLDRGRGAARRRGRPRCSASPPTAGAASSGCSRRCSTRCRPCRSSPTCCRS
jgi:glycine betaine/proline transport system permease protein